MTSLANAQVSFVQTLTVQRLFPQVTDGFPAGQWLLSVEDWRLHEARLGMSASFAPVVAGPGP